MSLSPSTPRLATKSPQNVLIEPGQQQKQHQQTLNETLDETHSNIKNDNSISSAKAKEKKQKEHSQHESFHCSEENNNVYSSLATAKEERKGNNVYPKKTKTRLLQHTSTDIEEKEVKNLIQTQHIKIKDKQCEMKSKELESNECSYASSKRRKEASTTVCPICAKVFNRAVSYILFSFKCYCFLSCTV